MYMVNSDNSPAYGESSAIVTKLCVRILYLKQKQFVGYAVIIINKHKFIGTVQAFS